MLDSNKKLLNITHVHSPTKKRQCVFISLLLSACTFNIGATSNPEASLEATYFSSDIPIVLSATRLAQPQTEAPATITIIDQQLIKASGAKHIVELFRLVPGMHVAYFRGNKPIVGYQGLSGEFPQGVQVLIDGRSVYSPLFGGVDWSNIPLEIEDIERIEVIRGSNGSSFGSNAFQAVINITTTHAVQLDGVALKTTIGERGYQRTLLRAGKSLDDINIRISASHTDDNGYQHNDDDSRQDSFTGRLDYQVTAYDNLQINVGVVNSLKQTHTPGTLLDPFDPPRQVDESNHSIHAKWERLTNTSHQFTTQFSYTRHISKDKVTSFFPTVIPLFSNVVTLIDYTNYYDRYDFEFEHQFQPIEQLRVSWGMGNRNDRVMQPYWMNSKQKFDNSIQRLFSNVEWRANDNIIINAGALWEHSQLSGDTLSPRLAVNYLPSPNQSFRLSVARSYRAPVLAENNFAADIVLQSLDVPGLIITQPILRSTAGLDPVSVNSFELGYHGLFFANHLNLDVKLFRNEYDRLIHSTDEITDAVVSLFGVPQATVNLGNKLDTFDNLYRADVNGYEIEVNYRPNSNNLFHAGYSYHHTNVGKVSNNDIQNILFSIPKDTFNILASHTFSNSVWASAAYYYTGSMEYLISGNPQGPMRRLDLNAGKSFQLAAKQNLDISLTLQLALDKNKDFLNEFNLDNRAYLQANVTFN